MIGTAIAAQAAKNIGKSKATPWIVGGIVVIGVAGTVYGYSKLFKGFKNIFGLGDDDEVAEIDESNERDKDLKTQGVKLSYSPSTYRNLSNKLETSIKGWGNDPQSIAEVFFKMKNERDVRALNSAFYVRDGDNMKEWLNQDILDNTLDWWVTNPETKEKMSIVQFVTPAGMVQSILGDKNIYFPL